MYIYVYIVWARYTELQDSPRRNGVCLSCNFSCIGWPLGQLEGLENQSKTRVRVYSNIKVYLQVQNRQLKDVSPCGKSIIMAIQLCRKHSAFFKAKTLHYCWEGIFKKSRKLTSSRLRSAFFAGRVFPIPVCTSHNEPWPSTARHQRHALFNRNLRCLVVLNLAAVYRYKAVFPSNCCKEVATVKWFRAKCT